MTINFNTVDMGQENLESQMLAYINLINKNNEKLKEDENDENDENDRYFLIKERLESERGICVGLSTVYGAMHLENNSKWWRRILANISNWDNELDSLECSVQNLLVDDIEEDTFSDSEHYEDLSLRDAFEYAINYVMQYQIPELIEEYDEAGEYISQHDVYRRNYNHVFEILTPNGTKIVEDSYEFEGVLSSEQLQQFLEENKNIIANSLFSFCTKKHATHLRYDKDSDKWFYYDPIFSEYENEFDSIEYLVDSILNNIHFSRNFIYCYMQIATLDEELEFKIKKPEVHAPMELALRRALEVENPNFILDKLKSKESKEVMSNAIMNEQEFVPNLLFLSKSNPDYFSDIVDLMLQSERGRSALVYSLELYEDGYSAVKWYSGHAPKSLDKILNYVKDTGEGLDKLREVVSKFTCADRIQLFNKIEDSELKKYLIDVLKVRHNHKDPENSDKLRPK